MDELFTLTDHLGPAKVVHLHQAAAGLRAVVAIDNTALGPAIGGVRMAPDVSTREAMRLARAMTLKNAMARLPHGGGKSVIFGDPLMPLPAKERLLRAFAQAIRELESYIPGPDMGTNETCMAWVRDEIGRAAGLPRSIGGIPLDELGATGWGLFHAIQVALERLGRSLEGQRVVVQGFGAVGTHAARFLTRAGAVLVGVGEIDGGIHDPRGLDVERLAALRHEGRPVWDEAPARRIDRDAVIDLDCDIWIPAARPDVLDAGNVGRLKARLVAQGANIPCTDEAEHALHARGVLVLPDFVANAGGVICGSVEYHGGTETLALETIAERVRRNTADVLEAAASQGVTPREAAVAIARHRVEQAMGYSRFHAPNGLREPVAPAHRTAMPIAASD